MPINRVDLDKICDYVPFVSTYTNIIDLFQKRHFAEQAQKNSDQWAPPPLKNRYVSYIEDKPWQRCVLLIIPIIGNVLVGFYDLVKSFLKPAKEVDDFTISRPSSFRHVNKEEADKKIAEEKETQDSEEDVLKEADELNKNDIYDNPPDSPVRDNEDDDEDLNKAEEIIIPPETKKTAAKLEYIPVKEQIPYLKSIGITEGLFANHPEFARRFLGSLSRNINPNDEIRKELKDNSPELEFIANLRKLPTDKVMELISKLSAGDQGTVIFREKLLMFLVLDPRLKFDRAINENIADLATIMIAADPGLRDRLFPLVILP